MIEDKLKKIVAILREHLEWFEMGNTPKDDPGYQECLELSAWLEGYTENLGNCVATVYSEMGKKGGKIGGAARAKSLTAERRKEIAQKAANTRWSGLIRTHKIN